jgi:iron complex transport system substrate-binding protein
MIKHRYLLWISLALLQVLTVLALMMPASLHAESFTDDEGRTITFARPFSRIISLYPAHTENLAYMGCESELIGIGESDTYPESIAEKASFSYRDNTEKFLAANPDLILIRPMISRSQPELMEKLRAMGIAIVSLQPTSIDQMFSYWHKLGQLCGKSPEAMRMEEEFATTLAELRGNLPEDPARRPLVYFEAIHSKMKTFDPSAISIFALDAGGGRNIATDASGRNDSNIAPYGKERILAKADAIDVFLSQQGRMNRVTIDEIYREPGFQLIKAVQTRSVYLVEEELVSRPTMRLLAGIRKIQLLLYPALQQRLQDLAGHASKN